MKKIVRWTATYETEIEMDENGNEESVAADIEVDVPGSRYVEDSFDVESIENKDE